MKKNKAVLILTILLLIALATAGFFGYKYFKTLFAQKEVKEVALDLNNLYGKYNDGNLLTVYGNEVLSLQAPSKKQGEMFYVPLELALKLSSDLHYDQAEKTLTYTDSQDVFRLKAGEQKLYRNNQPVELQIGLTEIDGATYLPTELLAKFVNYRMSYNSQYHILTVDNPQKPQTVGVIGLPEAEGKKKAKPAPEYLYESIPKEDGSVNYYYPIYSGMTVVIVGEEGDYYRVRSHEGFFGYVKKALIQSTEQILESNVIRPKEVEHFAGVKGKVNLVWHQVFNMTANASVAEKMSTTKGVNVISPTWFHIEDTEGNVSSLADLSYVRWAKQNGYKVWPLFSNSFNKEITHAVLSSTEKREKVIQQVLAYVDLYELDGINIDFEEVPKEDGPGFVQFIKEISIYLKQRGMVVSVDMYVPKPWTEHYGRAEIGKYIDYLIIMGYDEHWSTSPVSGSVASLGFVQQGVADTLLSVPAYKVVLGLPFYTRLWKEVGEGDKPKVTSKAYGMNYSKQLLIDKGAKIEWDAETSQYYGQYKEGDATYKMWLEDKRSLEQKLNVAKGYQLAGVAGWKLGLESEEAWEAISQYLNQ